MTLKDCYRILGVATTAKLDDVKRAYRRRAFELHPDLNPNLVDASRQFQLLNEAYVHLTRVLSAKEQTASAKQGAKAGPGYTNKGQSKTGQEQPGPSDQQQTRQEQTSESKEKAEKKYREEQERHGFTESTGGASQQKAAEETKSEEAKDADVGQEDVLRDILNDQFARRVFEDIYSEINKQQTKARQSPAGTPGGAARQPAKPEKTDAPKTKKLNLEWGGKIVNFDLSNGVGGAMRSWLRKQIDDELTLQLPRAKLFPGARVRLQIRQGLSNDVRVVEITLPPDFRIGKAIRLRGMGKKIGKWIGDLYLTIEPQQ